jgi:hypothetical protein
VELGCDVPENAAAAVVNLRRLGHGTTKRASSPKHSRNAKHHLDLQR